MDALLGWTDAPLIAQAMSLLAALFVIAIGTGVLVFILLYIIDRTQTKHAIRRNYPVIGRFRYLFENLGEYFRQYFFAMDREELPFNRAQRAWVYRAAKQVDTTVAFGSTRELRAPGTVSFVNTAFPTLDADAASPTPLTIGPYARTPYETDSFFNISGLSYGAVSEPAVRALSKGAARAGCWLNTGEGGLSRFHLEGGCDIVFQIGTAKYGVRDIEGKMSEEKLRMIAAHGNVRMFELKLSQGAKPGKGGLLPGGKVTKEIAAIRGIPEGLDSISPNRHPEIRTTDDLLDLIVRIRDVTGKPAGFKVVLGGTDWLDELFTAINRRPTEDAPDFITLDSADGGTGAAPQPLIDYMGMPIWESLPLLVDARDAYGLKDRIRIMASGKLLNPGEVAWAMCAGADFVNCGRGFMFALGCIQALQCNKNTCPTGVTTHDRRLQRGLNVPDKATRVHHYHDKVVNEVCMIAHSCGLPEPRLLRRSHARIMTSTGISLGLDEYYERWKKGEVPSFDARNGVMRAAGE